ncbi:TPA: hypothetical protein RI707_003467 [Vibrio cholerae]|nr:hypothetical protein [Vibrio cholerae]HDV5298620.1 hypothetical protein [Vibrio cholerae]HDV5306130.1 hypothetical protein [Vibrio cholerae]HDV5309792.1 hypothetical protein [Vibrio cholerae]HDV5313454.1 hypothetical protein [Vibrio cholerae]
MSTVKLAVYTPALKTLEQFKETLYPDKSLTWVLNKLLNDLDRSQIEDSYKHETNKV